ncbi:abrupt-like 5 [Homarus americanus]|uniref:Abrupt-like 5 n=1 Tax=Homarus americanus TaxID=6706 RepID=A0A8J5KBI4_HOMAM|nr:abrupt-like 5 [Homarus americanus]
MSEHQKGVRVAPLAVRDAKCLIVVAGGPLSSTPPASVPSTFVSPFPGAQTAPMAVVTCGTGSSSGVMTGGATGGRGVAAAAAAATGGSWVGAQCPICFKILRDKYKLRTHLADIHSAVQHVFTCPVCNRVYKTKNTLTNHISLSHRGYRKRRQQQQYQPPQQQQQPSQQEHHQQPHVLMDHQPQHQH